MIMLIVLIIISVGTLFLLVWQFLKDRRFLKKQVRDVLSEDMRKSVNLPTTQDEFPQELNHARQKPLASKKILEKFND